MPAPTAPLKPVADDVPAIDVALPEPDNDEEFALDGMNDLPESSAIQAPTTTQGDAMDIVDEEDRPHFPQVQNDDGSFRAQSRKVPVPPNRMSPLKSNWPQIYRTLPEGLGLAHPRSSYIRLHTFVSSWGPDVDLKWLISSPRRAFEACSQVSAPYRHSTRSRRHMLKPR